MELIPLKEIIEKYVMEYVCFDKELLEDLTDEDTDAEECKLFLKTVLEYVWYGVFISDDAKDLPKGIRRTWKNARKKIDNDDRKKAIRQKLGSEFMNRCQYVPNGKGKITREGRYAKDVWVKRVIDAYYSGRDCEISIYMDGTIEQHPDRTPTGLPQDTHSIQDKVEDKVEAKAEAETETLSSNTGISDEELKARRKADD